MHLRQEVAEHKGEYTGISPECAPVFSRGMAKSIKGAAILMMIAHHCFAFPNHWMDNFSAGTIPMVICEQFKICVAIFAFITGYGLYTGNKHTYANSLRKAANVLGQYWFQLFLVFLPVASVHFRFSAIKILCNMIAIYDNVVLFAWYIFFHCYVVLSFPLVKRLLNRGPGWDLAVIFVGGYCITVFVCILPFENPLIAMLRDCSIYYPTVGAGYLAAKYAAFDRVRQKIHSPLIIFLIPVIFLLRMRASVIKGFHLDVFYAPALIFALSCLLKKCRFLPSVLSFFGKHSFHMWLFHSIFFSAYTRSVIQPLISWTDYGIIRFLLVAALSTVAAMIIDKTWYGLLVLLKWLRSRICF